ncbi:MAG: VCBS repeat-containing protein [Prevotella sp.]|nr:VCBS repeat-containing protein [Prevotella sp.]
MMKTMLVGLALSAAMTANAQTFQKLEQTQNEELFMPLHRGIVSWADVNNDGRLDLVYGGQFRPDNDRDGSGDVTYETDENGEYVLDEQDNKILKEHTKWAVEWSDAPGNFFSLTWSCTANIFLNEGDGKYTREVGSSWFHWGEGTRLSTEARGLIPTTYGGYYFFDANNDGRLDAIITGRNEWGWNYANIDPNYPDGNDAYHALQIQNANGIFELQPTQFPFGNNEQYSLGAFANANVVFGDYDHDGLTDVLIQCYKHWKDEDEVRGSRHVGLYRNNGDGTFTEAKVFNPLPYETNPQPSNLFDIDESTLELDEPLMAPTKVARPTSHGASNFGDLNGDGWLDIVIIGYCDDGPTFTVYKNNQDGTFDEVDMRGHINDGTADPVPSWESEVRMADMNNDGWLDIVAYGTQAGEGMPKVGDVYFNTGDGDFNFTRSSVEGGNGLYGASDPYVQLADANYDGLVDVLSWGWTNINDMGWGCRLCTQNPDGTFALDTNFGDLNSGHLTFGDVNGDGTLDVCGDYWFAFDIYLNENTEIAENPEAPTDVEAVYEDGKLTVKWAGAAPEYGYNVFVKNTATGWTSMLLPANIESGAPMVLRADQNTLLRSEEYDAMSYTLSVPAGKYLVGVQAVKSDWTTSTFTTTSVGQQASMPGDVNDDGTVDVADISAVISVMAGSADYANADVNNDGTVDVADISNIISIMAGASSEAK